MGSAAIIAGVGVAVSAGGTIAGGVMQGRAQRKAEAAQRRAHEARLAAAKKANRIEEGIVGTRIEQETRAFELGVSQRRQNLQQIRGRNVASAAARGIAVDSSLVSTRNRVNRQAFDSDVSTLREGLDNSVASLEQQLDLNRTQRLAGVNVANIEARGQLEVQRAYAAADLTKNILGIAGQAVSAFDPAWFGGGGSNANIYDAGNGAVWGSGAGKNIGFGG